jgi:hypothetical protein
MPLPVSAFLSAPEAIRFLMDATGEAEDSVCAALTEAALMGAITATGCRHLSAHPNLGRYFDHPILAGREIVPSSAWGTEISWQKSRVGRYDLVRFDRADIDGWLALAVTDRQSGSGVESQANGPEATPSGTRTNRAAAAEKACVKWIARLKERPTKDWAFERAQAAIKETGPLSRKAFERAWATAAPADWKRGGRRRISPPSKI